MNILIIGVSGFLGRSIAAAATASGFNVFGLSRSEVTGSSIAATCLTGDRNNPDRVAEIVSAQKIDIVVDVIAMTLANTQRLISRLDGQIQQFVMLSSSDVYRNYELLHSKATGAPNLSRVDEDSELRLTRYPYRESPRRAADAPDQYLDDYDKIPIERAVMQMSTDWTILRLPMVYGPGDKQPRFRWAIGPMASLEEKLDLPIAWAEWETTYGYVENVASAVNCVLGERRAAKRIYNVAEKSPVNHLEWTHRIADVMQWNGEIELTDDPANPFVRRLEGLNLDVPFRISDKRIRGELGYREVIDDVEGLKRTVADQTTAF